MLGVPLTMPTRRSEFYGRLMLLIAAVYPVFVSTTNPLPFLSAGTTATRAEESTFLIPENPECDYDCQGEEKAYYCASNGRTYDSLCKVERARCNDPMLNATPGKCQDSTRCRQERSHSLRVQSQTTRKAVQIPLCQDDGTYAQVQCHMVVGYCWCVTPLGHMVHNSTVVIGKMPTCGKSSRSKRKSRCKSGAEKAIFAMKLQSLIVDEHRKRSSPTGHTQWTAATWKHQRMDRNNDGYLSTKEMNKLLRQYKTKLPRACMKVFTRHCDSSGDKKISVGEWRICIGAPPRRYEKSVTSEPPAPGSVLIQETTERQNDFTSDPSTIEQRKPGTAPQVRSTCKDVRQEILKDKMQNVKVPQCEGPNMEFWSPVQCHEITGYCYCVLRENGHPISLSSVNNRKPDCERLTTTPSISVPIPGCPTKAKVKFLRQVQNILIEEMLQAVGSSADINSAEPDPAITTKERAARWYFDVVDQNHDQVLTRKENKKFKKLLSGRKVPKKCLRKFTKHCDRNGNNKTTKDEFIACLEVRQQERLPRRPDIRESIKQLQTTDDPENY